MKILLVEDEMPAAKRLKNLLLEKDNSIEIIKHTDSIESTVKFLHQNPPLDLIFMDIQLADGISFEIFKEVNIKTPIIFTTAFDQYTLKAFKVNSIDYLLKPIDENELSESIEKYKKLYTKTAIDFSDKLLSLMQEIQLTKYKERLLIKRGQQLSYLKITQTAFCYADGKLCYAIDFNGAKYLLEHNLSLLEEQLEPSTFYRVNRHLMINIEAITKVHLWLGGRLKLETNPTTAIDTVVSRERVNGFKEWLGR